MKTWNTTMAFGCWMGAIGVNVAALAVGSLALSILGVWCGVAACWLLATSEEE